MKAVIYARYSSDNQREESIEGQLRECTAYCAKNDITILRSYIDRALSAKTDNRPNFQRMVKDSAKGLFDAVIVWKLDRFARNRYDSARYKAQLRKYGVKVLSATENISEGPEGIILESMLEGMAEYYSAELSEKVIRGHTENALKCKYNGGTPTFGYVIDKNKHYQLDPRTAPVVLEIFNLYAQGTTLKKIRDYLNDKGVTTVRGKKIDLNFIAAVLHNRKYIGKYGYREIVTPGGISAIVPQDLFGRVQQKVSANKKAPARHKAEDNYLLTMLAREDVVYWICCFRTLDVSKLEERRRLIDSFVNSVTIFDDHILITFNYKDGSERVTFDDIKRSDLKSVGGVKEPNGLDAVG